MTLKLKDPKAFKLARKIAALTGETMTRALTEALRERLSRLAKLRKRKTLLAIGRRCAATLKQRPVEHAVLLYDENGQPK